jgi:hypothetical protein
MTNKKVFTTKNESGEAVELAVVRPDRTTQDEAQKFYNLAFRNAIESKALVRLKLNDFVREQGIWSDEKEKQEAELRKQVRDKLYKLSQKNMKLSEARALALAINDDRFKLRMLTAERDALDAITADAQADNARFNFLLSKCLVDAKGEPYYESYDEYIERSNERAAIDGATQLALLQYNIEENFQDKFPEVQFLKKYGFMDEKGRLVDKEGNFVTEDGKLSDEEGRFVNENGDYVDSEGRAVDKDGNYLPSGEFLEDDE